MDASILALMIPLAPFLLGGLFIWTQHKQKELAMQSKLSAGNAAQYAQTIGMLEERVRVLERIVTDRGFDLATEIEALRHDTRPPALVRGHGDNAVD